MWYTNAPLYLSSDFQKTGRVSTLFSGCVGC